MPETRDVSLTLEDTGHLCHLMMADEEFRMFVRTGKLKGSSGKLKGSSGSFISGEARLAVLTRHAELYKKLADANDILMGKERDHG